MRPSRHVRVEEGLVFRMVNHLGNVDLLVATTIEHSERLTQIRKMQRELGAAMNSVKEPDWILKNEILRGRLNEKR